MGEMWYVSKRRQNFTGTELVRGQLVKPTGARQDSRLFGDNTHWVCRFEGTPIPCGTDGCPELFADDAALQEHRLLVHALARDTRVKAGIERRQEAIKQEERGETIGGHPVSKTKGGPGGPVPYLDLTGPVK